MLFCSGKRCYSFFVYFYLAFSTVTCSTSLPDSTLPRPPYKRTLIYNNAIEPLTSPCGPNGRSTGVVSTARNGNSLNVVRQKLTSLRTIVSNLTEKYRIIRLNNQISHSNPNSSADHTFPTPPARDSSLILPGHSTSKRLDSVEHEKSNKAWNPVISLPERLSSELYIQTRRVLAERSRRQRANVHVRPPLISLSQILPPSPRSISKRNRRNAYTNRYFRTAVRGLRRYLLSVQLARKHESRTDHQRLNIQSTFEGDLLLVHRRLRYLLCSLRAVLGHHPDLNTTSLQDVVNSLNNVWRTTYPAQMDLWAYVLFHNLNIYLTDLKYALRTSL